MKTIASFKIDHTKLIPGLYLSRLDDFNGHKVSTFDIRITVPNDEPPMDSASMHTIEHLGATWLRNQEYLGKDVIYFGPMGCKTGFYLVLSGQWAVTDIMEYVKDMFRFISHAKVIPGVTEKECGNYLHHNLQLAKYYSREWLRDFKENPQIRYPD